ncbi:hypothetical protein CANTEDRAFT_128081 [Yamadazyma tenuis ATCC 10573]|uniref:Elongation factor 1 alpha-like protein n=1 Tax=Candida tenuis (strain ATCC 10573 / BCRC 21748 / CBS 615 / JCM 9827 / NBRC 10315 / NRRL Y-1498 / VKM Y-70) TaxID=590646 RepID=G3BF60_CANTC|nr:uncharacterized protein CANTEDRAFT_128081 [Yamadazyma tenuis ATCC 10573]EGV60645.1 hypothetical protein CANTEDRAFT_128081 [Yamadazyma tenuis ATCC 10573]
MDDDYSDDGSVEFSEDLLNDQEYDQLLDTLPVLKQKLAKFDKGSQINELVLKESLYDHYFEVEEALEDLKVSHKLKRTYKFSDYLSSNFNTESPDEKVLNAQKKAFDDFNKLNIKTSKKEDKISKILDQSLKVDIKSELATNKQFKKPHKSFVVIGHVDAGKSTLMGRILLDLNIVDLKTVNKLIKESESIGKGSFALAWVMDQTVEERSRGVTIDIVATNFETETTRFTAIDAPGHKDFVPHLINGLCQADLALLIVDSITGEFESGFQLEGQTKEHTLLAKNLGIKNLCCVINKLDKEDWSQHRYEFIKDQLTDYLINEIGFEQSDLSFIPVSGLSGNNVIKRQDIPEFKWYEGQTLSAYLETIDVPKPSVDEIIKEPFNLVINDIIDNSNSEFTVVGKILSGVIQINDSVSFLPINEIFKVNKINMGGNFVKFSVSGEIVELSFSKKQFKEKTFEDVIIGDIVSNSTDIKPVKSFTCRLSLFNLQKPLLVGTPFVLFRNNFNIPARLTKIIEIDNSKKRKKHLISKQSALVEVEVEGERLLPLTIFETNPHLGKVVIRREGITIGAGTVVKL